MSVDLDLVEHVSDLLASGDTRSLKLLLSEERFDLLMEEKASDIIPIAAYYLTKEVMQDNPGVFRYSRKMLERCGEKGNQKECLMEFLAQIETLDEIKFQVLLKPIQTTLLRIPERKAPLMVWVMSVFYSFINGMNLPKDYSVDKEAKVLLDCDENLIKIREIYCLLVDFYEPFVNELSGTSIEDKRIKNLKLALTQGLMQLLGNPIVSLDVDPHEKASSALSMLTSKIVNFIFRLQPDPLHFLVLVEEKELIAVDEESAIMKECSCNEFKFSYVSVAVFVYLIFINNLSSSCPQVYNRFFLYKNCLTLAATLLRYKKTLILEKGLFLVKIAVEIVETASVPFSHLCCNPHKEVIDLLSNITIYQDVENNRKLAVELLKQHFYTFEPKAQYYIMLNSIHLTLHPNIMGFLTSMLTTLVRESFSNSFMKEYFSGKRLFDLIKFFCSLKKGAETDLIENKDQILSALNLIIFLTRRDRQNSTLVWNYTTNLLETFLNPLREGIKLSRAHYEQELISLSDTSKTQDRSEFSVTVGNEELGQMSGEDKRSVINSSLTVFDLIEHLLSRAEECVQDRPKV